MIVTYMTAILCVLGLVAGQLLFKLSAISLAENGSFFTLKTALTLIIALSLYGVTSIAWVWVLQKITLGRIYPIMALAFVLVPLGSHFLFGEKFTLQYFIGVSFIIIGIITIAKA